MEIRSLYKYFKLGWHFHQLNLGTTSNNKGAIRILDEFQNFVKEYKLVVTEKAMGDKPEQIKKKLVVLNDPHGEITPEISVELKEFGEYIDTTLDSELRLRYAYILPNKRLGLDRLQQNIDQLFGSNVFENLSENAKKDFVEAGQSLAFERYTASAFHILRGTEAELRKYYFAKVKRGRIKPPFLWGKIVKDFETKNRAPKGLLAVLDSIREDFRNPTAHPEKFYGEDEVQNLFTHCIDVVNRIYKELKTTKRKKA